MSMLTLAVGNFYFISLKIPHAIVTILWKNIIRAVKFEHGVAFEFTLKTIFYFSTGNRRMSRNWELLFCTRWNISYSEYIEDMVHKICRIHTPCTQPYKLVFKVF